MTCTLYSFYFILRITVASVLRKAKFKSILEQFVFENDLFNILNNRNYAEWRHITKKVQWKCYKLAGLNCI